MRSAQVYRWQIPMDAGVVLRDRRLKTRDGLYVCLREGEREGWGEISPLPGFSQETWEEAQSVLLAWVNNWLAGDWRSDVDCRINCQSCARGYLFLVRCLCIANEPRTVVRRNDGRTHLRAGNGDHQ